MKKMQVFTSQKDQAERLHKETAVMFQPDLKTENMVVNVYPEIRYQTMLGFGSAFTETSAYNYSKLSKSNQKKIIDAYFDTENGLGYSFCRTHIHSCDFAIDAYTYTDYNDTELKTFSIDRDRKYILPFVKAARARNSQIKLFASPWSPPAWMKDNGSMFDGGRLKDGFYQCWADYMVKYFAEYAKEGIEFFALTVQNEAMAVQTWESCVYTAEEEARFACDYLHPALQKAGLGHIKIMIWDHNRERVYDRARDSFRVPTALEKIWAVSYHWYSGDHFEGLDFTHEAFPDKPLVLTEYCLGGSRGEVAIGPHSSWIGAEIYAKELISNFNHHMSAAVDWNMLVDEDGGPYHNRASGCKSLIVANHEAGTVSLEPTYYAMAHFAKFIKVGAVRLGTSSFSEKLNVTSFENPNGSIATVMLNTADKNADVFLRLGDETAQLHLSAHSLTTCVIS